MIELPETYVLAEQINRTLVGKTVMNATTNASPHKFAWFTGDPAGYQQKLAGKTITSANPGTGYTCGGNTEIICGDMLLVISTPIKYHAPGEKLPPKHQLWLEFEDFSGDGTSSMTCTVQMWGAMLCYQRDQNGLPQSYKVNKAPTPLMDEFDKPYFEKLFSNTAPNLSVKAFLTTEQRIPGLGNGVLQDILFNAKIHPKTKLEKLTDGEIEGLYKSTKETLFAMTAQGGRDTERDLFGCPGGYKTILSANTIDNPCPVCGDKIVREAYLGGNIYYCPTCQPWKK